MTDQQAEALRLADALDSDLSAEWMQGITLKHISNELRRLHEENEALRARLAQPEQEPMAWYYAGSDVEPNSVALDADLDAAQKENCIPLYTAPPQLEWQGLTDEQIQQIEMSASSKLSAIYLAEAQLKGKNAL